MEILLFYPFSTSTTSALRQLEEAEAGRGAAEVVAGTPAPISDDNNNNNIGNDSNDDATPVAAAKE